MIRIFKGYEIDGSDTSFYLMTDKKELIPELLKFVLCLPIFDRAIPFQIQKKDRAVRAPHRDIDGEFLYEDTEKKLEQINSLIEKSQDFFINIPCQVTVLLDSNIKKELEQLTKNRPGGARENEGMQNPDGNLERGESNKYISVNVSFNKEKRAEAEDNYVKKEAAEDIKNNKIDKSGMVLNRKSYERLLQIPVFTISLGCGPGFYYEYAAWIMNKIADKFPDIGIDGGLDCSGAFTGGCTYSASIYAFERIELPWKKVSYAIEQLLLNFLEIYKAHSVWTPVKTKLEYYGSQYYVLVNSVNYVQKKFLNNKQAFDYFGRISLKDNAIKINEYQEFCDYLFSCEEITNEELIASTAVKLLIRADKPAKKKLKSWEAAQDEYLRKCYITACRKNGQRSCEIWVRADAAENMRKKLAVI